MIGRLFSFIAKPSRSNTIAPNGTSLHPNVHTPRDKERIEKKRTHTHTHTYGTSLRSGVVAVVKCRRCVPIGNRYRLSKAKPEPARPSREQIRAHAFKGGGNSCLFPTDGGGRLTTFHLRYRHRRAYTYTRRSPSVSLSLCPPCLLVSPLDRPNADHSSLSANGEPLSKSYATRHRSSVDYFSKSSGSRIFKWRLNETGSPSPPLPLPPSRSVPCERGCLHP